MLLPDYTGVLPLRPRLEDLDGFLPARR